jgi:hypothetical protein
MRTRTNDDVDVRSESPARRALACREGFLGSVTPEDVRDISIAIVRRAKEGDLAAAKFVLERLIGTTPVAEWPTAAAVRRDIALDELVS